MEDFFVTDFDEIRREQERKLEELSKNPPSDINFTYSKEELDRIISNYRSELEKMKSQINPSNSNGRTIEDYTEEWEYHYEPTASEIVDLVDSYNKLADKNNIKNVEYVVSQINQKYNNRMQLPNEIAKTMEEIKEHLNWLYQMRDINQYLNNKQIEQQQSQQMQSEQLKQQEQQIQQERFKTIQNELPLINEKLNYIKELYKNNEAFKTKETELLKERLYFYQKINTSAEDMLNGRRKEITQEDMDRLSSFLQTLDSIQQEIINSHKQPQQTTPVQEETYVTLEQLEPLLSESGYMCYGHGTGRKGNSDEVVDSIFNEGLRTKNNSLYYTTIGLSTPTPELKEQFKEIGMPEPTIEDLKKQFNNWQHQDSKKIIIARIPTEYINKAGDRSDLDGEMFGAFYTQKQQPNGQATNYLDSKFIIGCFDVDKQAVRLNKNFERTLAPETIEQLKENYKKTVEKTNARRIRQNLGITQEEINLSQQNQTQQVNYNTETYDNFDDNIEWNNTSAEQAEIDQLKEQIEKNNSQINTLLANMQPYMQIPKVNREISKVIEKNNEINSSQIIDSLNDYKTVVEIKQSLLTYLEQADKFIKDNVGKQQETVVEQQAQTIQQDNTQSLPDDFWKEFEQPQQEQKQQQPLPDNFWDEFDNPNNGQNAGPERKYNDDGTYTIEYITHLATTPLGFNKDIYDQLMQENEARRQQSEDQMTSGGRHM
jgi:hypothetical protein